MCITWLRNIKFINDFVENDLQKSLRSQSNEVDFVDYNDIILQSYTNEVIFIIHFVGKVDSNGYVTLLGL